jgi:hypothetical protein
MTDRDMVAAINAAIGGSVSWRLEPVSRRLPGGSGKAGKALRLIAMCAICVHT